MHDQITRRASARGVRRAGVVFLFKPACLAAGLLVLLVACAPQTAPAATPAPLTLPATSEPPTAVPATPTVLPATPAPSPTSAPSPSSTPPLSAVAMQGLKDAFNCLTNNLIYAPNINLTLFCPGYWTGSSANINTLDGTLIRKQLVPYLSPLDNLRWRFDGLGDVQKDERLSTTVNPVYSATLSSLLTGTSTLTCPSGKPAPFQTTVRIPIKGTARISVYDYPNQAQEYIQIESWTIQGNPLQDYCAALP